VSCKIQGGNIGVRLRPEYPINNQKWRFAPGK